MNKKLLIISTIFLWFIIHQIIIITNGLLSKPNKSEYAVILGNKVNNDSTLSKRLKARVLKALDLYNNSLVKKVFVSGGLGKEGFYEAQKNGRFSN